MKFNSWMHYQRARVYTLLKRYDQAIADLQQVLRMDSSCLRAASALGFLYATLGRNELAIEQFCSALCQRRSESRLNLAV